MTIERIAAAIKPILDEDRRADRERIAELERDAAHLRTEIEQLCRHIKLVETDFAASLEKCAALVVENKRLREDDEPERKPLDVAAMNRALDAAGVPHVKPEAPTLRIDPDMSDPQPGKLLVVRTDAEDALVMRRGDTFVRVGRSQLVGFLVETPAVEVKEQGPWVVYDETCDGECFGGRSGLATPYWSPSLKDCATFDTHEEAESSMRHSRFAKTSRVITLAEARAIEARR